MRGYLRTIALFLVFTALMAVVGAALGRYYGTDPITSMVGFIAMAAVMNFVMYFFSAKMVLWSTRTRLVTPEEAPRLHAIVERVAQRAGIPKPKVGIMPTMTPNAFATGRSPKHAVVAATEGILQILTDDELEGVLAHEISHVQNRDTLIMTVAATLASTISYIGFALMFGRRRSDNIVTLLLIYILAPLAAMVIQLAISRSREYAADRSGAELLGNGRPLASALRKLETTNRAMPFQRGNPSQSGLFIVNPFRVGSFTGMFRTHPRTEDRVKRLEEAGLA